VTNGSGPWTALVLAGSRGPSDPVAAHCGVRHKALAPVAGVPMLARVLRSLAASPQVGRIVLCLDDASIVDALPEAASLVGTGRLTTVPAATSPSLSVALALQRLDSPYPLLVTTADHPLLTPEMIAHFCAGIAGDADVAVALAPASVIRRDHPGAVRTFYKLGREGYSGCNLFAFRTPASARAAAFWAAMERHRKKPWRLIAAIGPLTLLRFVLGLLDVPAVERLLSRRVGATIRIVEMPFAEAAIDVDKPADLELAEAILRRRG
jgi:CTP:molybdopterin cytidylyltransferase MocA